MKILLISKSLEKKDPSFEGLITIFKKLEKYLRKKHTIFINDLTKLKEVDIINIHSSGFSGMMRYKKYGAKIIYSIHSNPEPKFFKSIYDQFQ